MPYVTSRGVQSDITLSSCGPLTPPPLVRRWISKQRKNAYMPKPLTTLSWGWLRAFHGERQS